MLLYWQVINYLSWVRLLHTSHNLSCIYRPTVVRATTTLLTLLRVNKVAWAWIEFPLSQSFSLCCSTGHILTHTSRSLCLRSSPTENLALRVGRVRDMTSGSNEYFDPDSSARGPSSHISFHHFAHIHPPSHTPVLARCWKQSSYNFLTGLFNYFVWGYFMQVPTEENC